MSEMVNVRAVPEDEDGMPVGYARWYNAKFLGQSADTARDFACEEAWRAGFAAAMGMRSEVAS